MRPFGVTNHHCRVDNEDVKIVTDSDFDRANASIAAGVRQALDIVMRCQPRQVILGMSSETFWNGVEASEGLLKELQDCCGVRVIMGAQACRAALELFGVKRLGVLTPYMPLGDRQVERYLTESGFAVVRLKGLRCQSPFQIGQTARTTLRDALRELDGDDIDALVPRRRGFDSLSLA
jgi:maleate isomerase